MIKETPKESLQRLIKKLELLNQQKFNIAFIQEDEVHGRIFTLQTNLVINPKTLAARQRAKELGHAIRNAQADMKSAHQYLYEWDAYVTNDDAAQQLVTGMLQAATSAKAHLSEALNLAKKLHRALNSKPPRQRD